MARRLRHPALASLLVFAGLSACGNDTTETPCTGANDLAGLTLQDCDGAALPLTALSEHRAAWLFLYTGW